MEAGHDIGARHIEQLCASFELETSEVVSVEVLSVEPCSGTAVEDDHTGRDARRGSRS